MADYISPGVYTKIIDLSDYVGSVPGTIGLVCALTQKGRDNSLEFVSSRSALISEWGEPNVLTFGKYYGQGPYIAYNYLGESGAFYFMRCMPDNAAYSNIIIAGSMTSTDSTAQVIVTYGSSCTDLDSIKSSLEDDGDIQPLCILYPIGRGQYYNQISVRLTPYSNPVITGVYVLDIYEKQSDGIDTIIESFEVSFEPSSVDSSGESLFIVDVLNTYSSMIRASMTKQSGDLPSGYDLLVRVFDKDIGSVSIDSTSAYSIITDTKQDFTAWQTSPETGNANYMIVAKDSFGTMIYGWLGVADSDETGINVFDGRDLDTASPGWSGDVVDFRFDTLITYQVKKANTSISDPFVNLTNIDAKPLRRGSDGDLRSEDGTFVTSVGENILAKGYSGLLTNPITGEDEDTILDTENYYFSMVFDAGYTDNVKTQISRLVQTRRDCVAIMDNGDNATFDASRISRKNNHTFNTMFLALYEEYNRVYDLFTGKDLWVSPIYHMSYILPRNDAITEVWYAAAGFSRAAIDSIKELRFNPKLAQRDQMYLMQLNPIVKFNEGYVVWGQLTSQAKPSALQDLNVVRLVLYIQRALSRYCKFYIFEMNDAETWSRIASNINMFLQDIQNRRGLYSFSVQVGATPYEIKTKTMHINITLNPTRVVEKIILNFFIV